MSSLWCPNRKREPGKRLTVWTGLGGCEVSSWKVRARGGRRGGSRCGGGVEKGASKLLQYSERRLRG